jgi:[NiFe] hydrogenase assembly HybE family chaperone
MSASPLLLSDLLKQRVDALVMCFARVQHERMQDMPLLNPALRVQAVGFLCAESEHESANAVADGVLITPWFMSLLRLPLRKQTHRERVGRRVVHALGLEQFDFIGADDEVLGYYETCALFSPMFEFSTQDLAYDTALAALREIREGVAHPIAPATPPVLACATEAVPARRLFLTGRGAFGRGGA